MEALWTYLIKEHQSVTAVISERHIFNPQQSHSTITFVRTQFVWTMDAPRTLALEPDSHSHHSSWGVPDLSKQLNMPRGSEQEGGLQIEGLRRILVENKREFKDPDGPRDTKSFLTLKNKEHFHHFPAPSLSGSARVCLLFRLNWNNHTCSSSSRPFQGKEVQQVIETGGQVLLCSQFDLYWLWSVCYCISNFDLCVARKNVAMGEKVFHNKTLPVRVAAGSSVTERVSDVLVLIEFKMPSLKSTEHTFRFILNALAIFHE